MGWLRVSRCAPSLAGWVGFIDGPPGHFPQGQMPEKLRLRDPVRPRESGSITQALASYDVLRRRRSQSPDERYHRGDNQSECGYARDLSCRIATVRQRRVKAQCSGDATNDGRKQHQQHKPCKCSDKSVDRPERVQLRHIHACR